MQLLCSAAAAAAAAAQGVCMSVLLDTSYSGSNPGSVSFIALVTDVSQGHLGLADPSSLRKRHREQPLPIASCQSGQLLAGRFTPRSLDVCEGTNCRLMLFRLSAN